MRLTATLLVLGWFLSAQPRPVILDDSAFYEYMPKGTIITQVGGRSALPAGSWLYNNTGLVMRSQAYLHASVEIPEAGT